MTRPGEGERQAGAPRRGIARRRGRSAGFAVTAGAALFGATLIAGGCSTGSLFGGNDDGAPSTAATGSTAATPAPSDGGSIRIYLDTMQQLITGDALTRAAVFNDAARDADIASTTTNRLRYALALSVPGHPGSDPAAASEQLGALLAVTDLLPEERMLITIQLRQAEQLQILAAANAELTRRIETAATASDAESAARLRTVLAENERLRRELEDKTTMLDAITNIERSISESEVQ